jgi:hypothetical protein
LVKKTKTFVAVRISDGKKAKPVIKIIQVTAAANAIVK